MPLGISDEHLALHDAVRRWVETHCPPPVPRAALEGAADHLPPFWDSLREQGWLGLHLPEEHGGEGYGVSELAVVLEELGRAVAPGPFLPTVLASLLISLSGSDEAKAQLLPDLADGSRTATVAFGLEEMALDGDGRVRGRAGPFVAGGPLSLLLVPVATGGGGEQFWVLDTTAPEVRVTPLPSLDATRPMARVEVDGADVPEAWRLRSGAGPLVASHVAAVLLAAEASGVADWCVDTAASYAKVREQFGRPIGQFQAVKHRCADMLMRLEHARAAVWDAARAVDGVRAAGGGGDAGRQGAASGRDEGGDDGGGDGGGAVAEAFLAGSVAAALAPEAAFECAKDCIQVLGGVGFTWEHDAHLYLKRATAVRQVLEGPVPWRDSVVTAARRGVRRTLTVDLPPEVEAFRGEVRAFLADLQRHDKAEWRRVMADAGYLAAHYPPPWGLGATPAQQLVIDEEFRAARVRIPHLQVGAWVLPTLVAHGTAEQQERFVPPTLRGEISWCQLFSEPGAGSDLAGLSTKAVRADGGWLLTGQKVWTTFAHQTDYGLCLARTAPLARSGGRSGPVARSGGRSGPVARSGGRSGPVARSGDRPEPGSAPKHEGITCFVVDMKAGGIEVRPLRELTGAEMFNEVFLEDVFVPDDCVVGAVNDGWRVGRTTLENERVSMGSGSSFGHGVEALLQLPRDAWTAHLGADREIGRLLVDAQALAVMAFRMTVRSVAGLEPGPESSLRKLLGVEHDQRVQEVGLLLLGPDGAVNEGEAAMWVAGFLGNRCLTIAGGTSEVQRNVIAERLLGLPKDP